MAKRDHDDDELHEDAPEQKAYGEPEEGPMAKDVVPSLAGLVKMHKDGRYIHAHPDTVEHHEKKGWKRA